MNCEELMHELSAFIDGESKAEVVATIRKHLTDCADCQIVVDTTKKTVEIICNSEPLPLPEDVRARLDRALAAKLGGTHS
ncbi:MAG: anti-sigma factor family protein [Terriglobia bacterium]